MTSRRTLPRAATTLLVAAGLALVAGCGGSGPESRPVGSDTAATSAPSPTPDQAGATDFEDQAPVRAARAWTVAMGRSVNDGDDSLRRVKSVATTAGVLATQDIAASDLRRRAIVPGPEPFTPLNVNIQGDEARVTVCWQSRGWSLDRKTRKPLAQRVVVPAEFVLKNQQGWKFVDLYDTDADCTGVDVPETKW